MSKTKIGISVISLAHPISMILGLEIKVNKKTLSDLQLSGIQFFPLKKLMIEEGLRVMSIEGPWAEHAAKHKGLGEILTGNYFGAIARTSEAVKFFSNAKVVDLFWGRKPLIETANLPGRSIWELVKHKHVCLDLMHVFEYYFGREEIMSGKVRPQMNGQVEDNIRVMVESCEVGLVQIQARSKKDLEDFVDCQGHLYEAFKFFCAKSHEFGKSIPDIIFEFHPRCVRSFGGFGFLQKDLILEARRQVRYLIALGKKKTEPAVVL